MCKTSRVFQLRMRIFGKCFTAKHCQLVVMALKPGEEIGAEVHTLDQFFRIEQGSGEALLNGVRTTIQGRLRVTLYLLVRITTSSTPAEFR